MSPVKRTRAWLLLLVVVVAAAIGVSGAGAARVHPPPSSSSPSAKLLGTPDALRSKELRVLAFGDSLTEGWTASTRAKTPYTWSLESRLRSRLAPKGVGVRVVNGGIGSKGVLDDLNPAWYARLGEARAEGRPYQYVVFLAGINDILMQ